MSIIIRRFNEQGVQAFESLLARFRELKAIVNSDLEGLLFNDLYTSQVPDTDQMDLPESNSKSEISTAIITALNLEGNVKLFYDQGLWTWLAALMLKRLVPPDKVNGELHFKESALYVLETSNWKRYYRHLVAFPCWIKCTLKESGKIFMRGDIHQRGEAVEQLAAVQDIQRNTSILDAATLLYFDDKSGKLRKGAASKDTGGTLRRFREVIKQFKVTYDLNAMTGQQIVDLLPGEFSKWRKRMKVDA